MEYLLLKKTRQLHLHRLLSRLRRLTHHSLSKLFTFWSTN